MELADRGHERPAEGRRNRETRETMLQCLDPSPVGALGGRRLEQEILGHPHRQPEGKDSLAPRPPGRRFRETRILDAYSRHDLEAMFSV